jgi:hypothetical protein
LDSVPACLPACSPVCLPAFVPEFPSDPFRKGDRLLRRTRPDQHLVPGTRPLRREGIGHVPGAQHSDTHLTSRPSITVGTGR